MSTAPLHTWERELARGHQRGASSTARGHAIERIGRASELVRDCKQCGARFVPCQDRVRRAKYKPQELAVARGGPVSCCTAEHLLSLAQRHANAPNLPATALGPIHTFRGQHGPCLPTWRPCDDPSSPSGPPELLHDAQCCLAKSGVLIARARTGASCVGEPGRGHSEFVTRL